MAEEDHRRDKRIESEPGSRHFLITLPRALHSVLSTLPFPLSLSLPLHKPWPLNRENVRLILHRIPSSSFDSRVSCSIFSFALRLQLRRRCYCWCVSVVGRLSCELIVLRSMNRRVGNLDFLPARYVSLSSRIYSGNSPPCRCRQDAYAAGYRQVSRSKSPHRHMTRFEWRD